MIACPGTKQRRSVSPPRWRAAALAAFLLAQAAAPFAAACAVLTAQEAEARSRTSSGSSSSSRSSSSSSYSKSSSSSTRTPSYSSYANSSRSESDKTISRQNSAAALNNYRRSQEDAAPPPSRAASAATTAGQTTAGQKRDQGGASSASSSSSSSWSSSDWPSWLGKRPERVAEPRRPSADVYAPYRYYDQRWTPPAYAMQNQSRFGVWDAALLWFLFETLNRPGHAAFFHDHAEDPGVQAWRRQADELAQSNGALQPKLQALDAAVTAQAAAPRQPGRLPDDVADKVIAADQSAPANSGGAGDLIVGLIVLALVAVFLIVALYWVYRLWRGVFSRKSAPPPAGDKQMFDLFGGKDKKRGPFRVGMTVAVDPTPFLLAGDQLKVKPPETSSDGLTNVKSVGTLNGSALTLHRLYLTDGDFVQIHLSPKGSPDECRLFHVIDEVEPANEAEWDQWLDKREGMIGWRDFQTPDGKTYERAWSPGPARIAPVKFSENEDGVDGLTLTKYECMLYRADTGLADPAPQTEYLLVSLVERDGQAWVEIAAGVDVNPASLSLT